MVMVSSLNGKITKGDNPDVSAWTSPEDALLFRALKEQYDCFVMGRGTYKEARKKMRLTPGKLRIVLTKHPENYSTESVAGQLEFTSELPKDLLDRLAHAGYSHLLLLGGAELNAVFLHEGLVDEIRLTIEPILFGEGKNLVTDLTHDIQLKLISSEKLNSKGTLHMIYEVVK